MLRGRSKILKKNHIYCMILLEHVEKGKTEIRSVVPGDEGGKGD